MLTYGSCCSVYLSSASCGARLSTAGLLAILGMLNRRWYWGFLALLMLDIFSHWFQMYATMASGASTHKVALNLLQGCTAAHNSAPTPLLCLLKCLAVWRTEDKHVRDNMRGLILRWHVEMYR